jgi:hypothetical protein
MKKKIVETIEKDKPAEVPVEADSTVVESNPQSSNAESTADVVELTAEVEHPSDATPRVDNLLDAVTEIFPDYDLNNENMNGWIVEALKQYKNADLRIDEVLQNNPEFAEILKRVYEGEDAISAMAGVISPEEYADMVENGGSKAKESRESRVQRLKELREWEKSRTDNLGVSEQTVRQFQSETGKSDDEMMKILDTMNEINSALNDGKVTKRELLLIDKLLNADANAQTAAEAAAIAARNQNIEARKSSDFNPRGDGLPPINSGGAPPKNNPLAGTFLDGIGERKSAWGV